MCHKPWSRAPPCAGSVDWSRADGSVAVPSVGGTRSITGLGAARWRALPRREPPPTSCAKATSTAAVGSGLEHQPPGMGPRRGKTCFMASCSWESNYFVARNEISKVAACLLDEDADVCVVLDSDSVLLPLGIFLPWSSFELKIAGVAGGVVAWSRGGGPVAGTAVDAGLRAAPGLVMAVAAPE